MTKITRELVDAGYDAEALMSMLSHRLERAPLTETEATNISWLLGTARKRLRPLLDALEALEGAE